MRFALDILGPGEAPDPVEQGPNDCALHRGGWHAQVCRSIGSCVPRWGFDLDRVPLGANRYTRKALQNCGRHSIQNSLPFRVLPLSIDV